MADAPTIVWYTRDLRLSDHAALSAAAKAGPVIPVYVLRDGEGTHWPLGSASRWWLAQSLRALGAALENAGSRLILRRGEPADILADLCRETGAHAVHWTRGYEPDSARTETAIRDKLKSAGVTARRFCGRVLYEPEEVINKDGGPYKVFTPFYKACLALGEPGAPVSAPQTLSAPKSWPQSDRLADWGLEPTSPDWAGGMRAMWTPGEAGAHQRLSEFLNDAGKDYGKLRNRPDIDATSRLSPFLAFGEISPRQVWAISQHHAEREPRASRGIEGFLREVIWREFSYHLLHHWPDLPEHSWRSEFDKFPWKKRSNALRAWQRGQTGYPIVDAGMRQLWQIGWMHNRVRMIAASFLIKDLLIPWQDGEAWFWDTLVDADLANNAASWQWVAGSGADAAPYFRVFNPILQGAKFDPQGDYVRRFVPELANLPNEFIHAPWEAPALLLREAGVRLGETYPAPIVDHAEARKIALAAYEDVKAARPA